MILHAPVWCRIAALHGMALYLGIEKPFANSPPSKLSRFKIQHFNATYEFACELDKCKMLWILAHIVFTIFLALELDHKPVRMRSLSLVK